MKYVLFPVAVTQGDFKKLVEVCKQVLGESPTRGLDQTFLKTSDPAAFLSVLSMDNKPLDTLRHGFRHSSIFDHYSLSFIAVLPSDLVIELHNITRLKVFAKQGKREYVTIMSGTLSEWVHAVRAGCCREADKDIRGLMSSVLAYMDRVGFKQVFDTYTRMVDSDGATILSS